MPPRSGSPRARAARWSTPARGRHRGLGRGSGGRLGSAAPCARPGPSRGVARGGARGGRGPVERRTLPPARGRPDRRPPHGVAFPVLRGDALLAVCELFSYQTAGTLELVDVRPRPAARSVSSWAGSARSPRSGSSPTPPAQPAAVAPPGHPRGVAPGPQLTAGRRRVPAGRRRHLRRHAAAGGRGLGPRRRRVRQRARRPRRSRP